MIPKIKEIKIPLLKLLAVKSPMTWDECTSELSKQFHLQPADLGKMMPNGKCGAMKYRVGWAKAYLKKEDLVDAVSRGVYAITEKGQFYLEKINSK